MAGAVTKPSTGMIDGNVAYSKSQVLSRMGISQAFWGQMLDNGLPYTPIGHQRWVLGRDLIDYIAERSTTKRRAGVSEDTGSQEA